MAEALDPRQDATRNLALILENTADRHGWSGNTAYIAGEARYTYSDLYAGMRRAARAGVHDLVISPWAGVGVLAARAAAALLAAGVLLQLRGA